jgi:hypothetical protein
MKRELLLFGADQDGDQIVEVVDVAIVRLALLWLFKAWGTLTRCALLGSDLSE